MFRIAIWLQIFSLGFFTCSCRKEENSSEADQKVQPGVEASSHDGRPFDTAANKPGGPVMMQAFYWDVPAGGTWWDTLTTKVDRWADAGIDSIWLPPVSKGQSGGLSMGYDPTDYFDFGNFDQNGSVETRFGSKSELENLISKAHAANLKVYADIVLNHNSGGASEANQYTNSDTWTDFSGVASGKFPRSQHDYHPNWQANTDEGVFGGFPDLCHANPYVKDWLWKRNDSVAKYYRNTIGFDGWRFDYVKGFGAWVVKDWIHHAGGFSVGELWETDVNVLASWAQSADCSVFDFACYYKMNDAFDGNNLALLRDDMMWKRDPFKAVTFVTNHDTDEIDDKMLAYAYILTHEGLPTIFSPRL